MLILFLVLLLGFQVALPLLLYAARNRLIFFPSPEPAERGLPWLRGRVRAELVRIRRPDGREPAAYDHLIDVGVEPGRIVLFGESLGVAVALRIATERSVAGVVAQSGFSSMASIARDAFPNQRRIHQLQAPVLLVHGAVDEIVPITESRRLLSAAPPGSRPPAAWGALVVGGGRAVSIWEYPGVSPSSSAAPKVRPSTLTFGGLFLP